MRDALIDADTGREEFTRSKNAPLRRSAGETTLRDRLRPARGRLVG